MKYIVIILGALVCVAVSFYAGTAYGEHRATRMAHDVVCDMALRLYNDVKRNSGGINSKSPDYKNIKGTIHILKDMDLAVVDHDGVIVIKAYE